MKTEYKKSEVDSNVRWFRSTDIPETSCVSDKLVFSNYLLAEEGLNSVAMKGSGHI
jgi:hypothetical protein